MRKTHPYLYKSCMTIAILSIGLGLNFWFLTPAFMPLKIPKELVAPIFFICGVIKLGLLLFSHNRTYLRLSMALSIVIYLFWAIATTYDFFARSLTSLQLPMFVTGVAVLGLWQLLARFTEPATAEKIDEPN